MSAQHRFLKGRATVTNLIEFTSYVLNCEENDVQVHAVYTDFSAFDKESHRLLSRKLAKLMGFGGRFLLFDRPRAICEG
jgi:hypothetical protein